MRFERPVEKNRWDCPLFHVNMTPHVEHNCQTSSCESIEGPSSVKVLKDFNTTEPAALPSTVFRRTAFKKSISVTPEVISNPETPVDEDKAIKEALQKIDINDSVDVQSSALSISGSYIQRSVVGAGSSYEQVISTISDYLETAIAPAPNSSTIPKVHASADLLYQLDQVSQTIVQMIVQHQKESVVEGTPLVFSEYDRSIVINRHVGISELQRHRRQFVKVNTMHPPSTGIDVGATFVDFLAQQL
jgi:tRNA uridine 5-carbamoylmethylation protein Kti12